MAGQDKGNKSADPPYPTIHRTKSEGPQCEQAGEEDKAFRATCLLSACSTYLRLMELLLCSFLFQYLVFERIGGPHKSWVDTQVKSFDSLLLSLFSSNGELFLT